jgi:hypothetical protein
MTTYPETIDTWVPLTDAIQATQAKIGIGASTPTVGTYLQGRPGGASAWASLAPDDIAAALIGTGDTTTIYLPAVPPNRLHLTDGSASEPTTTIAPTFKASRIERIARADLDAVSPGADGGERLAAIVGVNVGAIDTEVQAVGVFGGAKTRSVFAGLGNDACGVYGVGRALVDSDGVGIGGFFCGRRESDAGKANGAEIHVANYGASAAAYNATGFSPCLGVWLNCSGSANSAAAIVVSNAFGRQFEVGLAFTAQSTGGPVGGVKQASIRDDSSSVTALDIRGSHAYGVDLAGAALTGVAVRLPNNKAVAALTTSGATVEIIKMRGDNRVGLYSDKLQLEANGRLWLDAGLSQAGAGALLGYLKMRIGTTDVVLPYYAP